MNQLQIVNQIFIVLIRTDLLFRMMFKNRIREEVIKSKKHIFFCFYSFFSFKYVSFSNKIRQKTHPFKNLFKFEAAKKLKR